MEFLSPEEILKQRGVGLTGSIATGKSTVAALLQEQGHVVIDADDLAREAVSPLSPGLTAIVATFGAECLNADGTLNRRAMRARIVDDAKARERLEDILHPAIRALLHERLQSASTSSEREPVFYEASLIFERGRQGDFHKVWVTHCSPTMQLERLMTRDGMQERAALALIASQWPSARKASLADLVIDTNGSIDEMRAQVLEAVKHLRTTH